MSTISNSYILKQTRQTHHSHVFACLSVRTRMRLTQTPALVPSVLVRGFTRSDFAAFRFVSVSRVAIRSDAIWYNTIVPKILCCFLDTGVGGRRRLEGAVKGLTASTALGQGRMHLKEGCRGERLKSRWQWVSCKASVFCKRPLEKVKIFCSSIATERSAQVAAMTSNIPENVPYEHKRSEM